MAKNGTKFVFDEIKKAVEDYRNSVNQAYAKYRNSIQRARGMYSEAYFKNEREKLQQAARAELSSAYYALTSAYREFGRKELCACMAEYATKPPKPALLDTLRLYHEFGLEMSRPELDALLHDAVDSYIGMRALAKVAEGSNFRLTAPDLSVWEKDIERLDRTIESAERYVPQGFSEEAEEIGTRHYTQASNVVRASYYTSSTVGRLMVSEELKNFGKHLDEMFERWTAAFIPAVTVETKKGMTREEIKDVLEAKEQEHEDAVTAASSAVSVEDTSNVKLAANMGKQRAEADRQADAVIRSYM